MFSRKKIAAVSGLVGGIAVSCVGLAQAHTAGGPGGCSNDLLGNLTCTQRIQGEVPEGETPPHQETCKPVQPVTVPGFLGTGIERLGPEVTCSPQTVGVPANAPRTVGVPAGADGRRMPLDMPR
ncbi:hypothetical protein [Streptomyces monashensis]|uniref:Intersectin-EH binding protein Ibp1 n=1 Tax=Streptomyces monashensis TaxID=1678012 RepID=A0A1S2PQ30_9ACTN|nr:hypothetical protein [Streptomyces monashensis]OIJ95843.1 hypothetical protein BIV23_33565 [Streptomyces monashensis]